MLHRRYIDVLKIRGRVDSGLSFPVVVVAVFYKADLKHIGTNDMADMFPFLICWYWSMQTTGRVFTHWKPVLA